MKHIRLILALLIILALIAIGCVHDNTKQLSEVEVKEYNGERLSPISSLRDNSIKGPQYVDTDRYTLRVNGLVEKDLNYSYKEVLNHQQYSKAVVLNCVEGWSAKILWKGVLVKDLIYGSNPYPNATTVIFYAYDGYTTSLPLDYIVDNNIMLAYEMNGVTLPPERGYPFQLVAESKWGYKWIKWVKRIELTDNADFRGEWESVGYSNNGDLNSSFFEK